MGGDYAYIGHPLGKYSMVDLYPHLYAIYAYVNYNNNLL